MKVATIAPDLATPGTFYTHVVAFMKLAASQLGIRLEVLDCGLDGNLMVQQAHKLVGTPVKPDYLLINNSRGVARKVLSVAAEAGVKAFVVCEGLLYSEKILLGGPGEKLEQWIGELLPDDENAGYLLGRTLIDQAQAGGLLGSDGLVHVGGLGGELTSAALLRVKGLQRAGTQVAKLTVVTAGWSEEKGKLWTKNVLSKDPEISVLWAANDAVAMGAYAACQEVGRLPGKDVLIGGIDLDPRALQLISNGALACSVGGHVIDGARALILLHDHAKGFDLPELSIRTAWVVADRTTAADYLKLYDRQRLKAIDFRGFSRALNPHSESVACSMASLLR